MSLIIIDLTRIKAYCYQYFEINLLKFATLCMSSRVHNEGTQMSSRNEIKFKKTAYVTSSSYI